MSRLPLFTVLAVLVISADVLAQRVAPLIVIDDSGDMRPDTSFRLTKDGRWPALVYLNRMLNGADCTSWSAFRLSSAETVRRVPCDRFTIQPDEATSPLVEVISKTTTSRPQRDIYFVTNGYDWQTEGGDDTFRTEMNVGADLCRWMKSDQNREVAIGYLRDRGANLKSKPRPLVIIGLVATDSFSGCVSRPQNLPSRFELVLARVSNEIRVLQPTKPSPALLVSPAIHVLFPSPKGLRPWPLAISPNGTLSVPGGVLKAIVDARSDREAVVEVRIIARSPAMRICHASLLATFSTGQMARADCTFGNAESIACRLPLSKATAGALLRQGSIQARFAVSHSLRNFLGSDTPETLRRTVDTLAMTCARQVPFKVKLSDASLAQSFTLTVQR